VASSNKLNQSLVASPLAEPDDPSNKKSVVFLHKESAAAPIVEEEDYDDTYIPRCLTHIYHDISEAS
jgi:hypothetical protein